MKLSLLLWLALVRIVWNQTRIGLEEEEPIQKGRTATANETTNTTANAAVSIGHLASLRMLKMERIQFGAGHICAGSLIRVNAVLTAAQCFVNMELDDGSFLPISDFIVVLGTPNRFQGSFSTMIFRLKYRVLMQDVFDVKMFEMDVAVIILSSSVPEQHAVVKPIKITDQTFRRTTECQMSGWGRDPHGYSSESIVSVAVTVIGPRICRLKQVTQEFFVSPGMLCAKHLNKLKRSFCTGDVGGSLVCQGELAGIISWGVKCSDPYHPGIYTDVLYYTQWINESLANPTQQDEYFAQIGKPQASAATGMRPRTCLIRSMRFFVQSIYDRKIVNILGYILYRT
ncbi:trypsin eta-like [Drosophila pseudoobscura]|uniref:Trypsin eta-like n=1 Tax=Drosophila pseudoobscura pseudoobscura TaxID=46245 RepID=A0A6I8UZJ8_DROPS|nr:trypsin eta [Drosophila pseudoobscura]